MLLPAKNQDASSRSNFSPERKKKHRPDSRVLEQLFEDWCDMRPVGKAALRVRTLAGVEFPKKCQEEPLIAKG